MTNNKLDERISIIESRIDSMERVIDTLILRIEYRDKVWKAMESYLGVKKVEEAPKEEQIRYVKKAKKRLKWGKHNGI